MEFDWRRYFEEKFQNYRQSSLMQVGKSIDGREVPWTQVDLIINHLVTSLNLKKTDNVIDLGCGNGIITEALATKVLSIKGYDFSPSLIKRAKELKKHKNVKYSVVDLRKINSNHLKDVNIVLLYEVLQHLTIQEFNQFMESLSANAYIGSRIFIGGIPDKARLRRFYNTDSKYNYFLASQEKKQPHLGLWWSKKDLFNTIDHFGWTFDWVSQPTTLYTSHYRFDCILNKS